MRDNLYTGETKIVIGSKECTMVFDFRALSAIYSECGQDAIKQFFSRDNVLQQSPLDLAKIVVAGLKRNHPEANLDMVLDGLPYYAETVAILSKALVAAYFGPDFGSDDKSGQYPDTDAESKKN